MRYILAFLLVMFLLPVASAEDHTILVSQSPDGMSYYFEPEVLNIDVGDNVTFVWDNGSHNVAQVASSASNAYTSGFRSGAPQVGVNWTLPSEYTAQDGSRVNCVVIHRAMLGAMERFLGVLIEHLAGVFPLWLTPLQTIIIPIADRHIDYCKSINIKLKDSGIRSEVDESNDRMNAKIRNAQIKKIPYMIIIGDNEIKEESISVRTRSKNDSNINSIIDLIEKLNEEINLRSI